ncbi:MAG: phosphoglycerate dehydrogenase [Bacteroidota bacterium]|nr:phosphoglycerate dehydrogenase [Bacteroidota bacterium]
MKILITDPIEKSCVDILTHEGFQVDLKPGLPADEIKKIVSEYAALVVRSGTKVTADIIEKATSMKVIGRAGAGVDNIDSEAASRKGIIVMNTPGGNTISTAEHTFSMLMALSRNIPNAHASMVAGKWDRKKFMGTELLGKTLGIVGLGKIGHEVALRAQAFGMTTIGYDPVLSADVAAKINVELVSLDEIYRRSDFITVHTPLNNETRGLLNDATIAKCKKGVRLLNCARGGIIDEAALLRALDSGHVAGAAIDVYSEEPPKDYTLAKHPKVVATPHLGASTEEAQEKVAIQIAHQIADALKDRGIVGAVNASALQSGIPAEIKPFLSLAEKLGMLQAQVMNGKLKELTIELRGELLHKHSELLKAGVLRGLLSKLIQVQEPINYINAPVIAQSLGVRVSEKKEADVETYTNLFTISYKTDVEERSFAGTVFGGKYLKIVRLDRYYVEGNPEGTFLYYTNIDRPGMLAKVGTILAEANINIAGLSLGRTGAGERALTVVSVDNPIPDSVLEKVKTLDGVFHAKVVTL